MHVCVGGGGIRGVGVYTAKSVNLIKLYVKGFCYRLLTSLLLTSPKVVREIFILRVES